MPLNRSDNEHIAQKLERLSQENPDLYEELTTAAGALRALSQHARELEALIDSWELGCQRSNDLSEELNVFLANRSRDLTALCSALEDRGKTIPIEVADRGVTAIRSILDRSLGEETG